MWKETKLTEDTRMRTSSGSAARKKRKRAIKLSPSSRSLGQCSTANPRVTRPSAVQARHQRQTYDSGVHMASDVTILAAI
jgi:hypothetical protein